MTDAISDATWAPVDLTGVTELRVHGVGGTPPAEMLGTPAPVQVSGDRTAGCWRGPDRTDARGRRRHVEAYAWGGLTARSAGSALWLLVLPFALINVAGWMSPVRGSERFGGLVRVAGLAVTGLYVAFACTASMDFAAFQCAGARDRELTCSADDWWLIGVGNPAQETARRVLVGAVVPLILVALVWAATRRSRQAYEQYSSGEEALTEDGLSRHCRGGLEKVGFWRGEGYAARLAEVHLAVGFAIVSYLIARTTAAYSDSSVAALVAVLSAATIVAAVVLAASTSLRRRLRRGAILGTALAPLVVVVPVTWFATPVQPTSPPSVLPGSTDVFNVFIGLLVPTVLALLAVGMLDARSRKDVPRSTRLRWAVTPAATVASAYMLSLTVLAGIVLWVGNRLGDAQAYTRQPGTPPAIEYAQAFEVLARGVALALVLFVVTAAVTWLVKGRSTAADALARASEHWAGVAAPEGWVDARESVAWQRRVRRSLRVPEASLSTVEWAIWVTALAAIPAALLYLGLWLREMHRAAWATPHIEVQIAWMNVIPLELCTWLLTSVPIAAVFVLRRAIISPSTRRSLAIAWDVATFWPRSFHPLAPPSYAERAVPELQARLARLWRGEPGRRGSVLLLGHSQGSVLVTAALASLDDAACPAQCGDDRPLAERLSVITYGSPVRRLYARHFPAYFSHDLVTRAVERLRHPGTGHLAWLNCYRDSDYVGHRLVGDEGCPTLDCYLPDPPHPFAAPADPAPPVRAHAETGYRHQRGFRERVRAEVARLAD